MPPRDPMFCNMVTPKQPDHCNYQLCMPDHVPDSAVVVLSGGLDSTVLLSYVLSFCKTVRAISFMYGQRHAVELTSAVGVCDKLGVHHQLADLTDVAHLFAGQSSQTNRAVDVPHGHYTDANMAVTVVPARNLIMLSVAAGYAISQGLDSVYYGAHAGDHAVYSDCRPSFVYPLQDVFNHTDERRVALLAPFLHMRKADIVRIGHALGAPMRHTFSCYKGHNDHCGKCGTCVERREAFELAGVADPTVYAA